MQRQRSGHRGIHRAKVILQQFPGHNQGAVRMLGKLWSIQRPAAQKREIHAIPSGGMHRLGW